MCKHLEGVGITWGELREGVRVMVPVGTVSAMANGHPCLIAWGGHRYPLRPTSRKHR